MIRIYFRHIIIAAMTLIAGIASAQKDGGKSISDSALYKSLETIDSRTLLKEASANFQNDTLIDRAVAAISVVANRYYANPKDAETRRNATDAFYSLGCFYHIKGQDFAKAYKALMSGCRIAEEDSDHARLAEIYSELANLHHNSSMSEKMSETVKDYMTRAFDEAKMAGNINAMSLTVYSMVTTSFNEGEWNGFDKAVDEFINKVPKDNGEYDYVVKTAEACRHFLEKDYPGAERLLMEVRGSLDKDSQPVELFNTNSLLAIIYNKMGSPDAVEKIQRESLDLASRKGYLMYEADISKALSDQFRATGNNDSANLYYGKYLFLKDSLEQRHGFNSVERLGFMSQIESINEEVELLSVKRQEERRIRIAVASALVVVIVVLLSLLWIYINLRNSHAKIFIRNEELLRQSEQYRLLLEQSKATVADIQPKTPQNDTSKEEISDGGEDLDVADVDTMRQIYARVLAFMEESSAIYEPGFSIYDLSRMVKMSVRNVSKAINSCYKNNFHQLLNDYRIREVRRMMHSREYDNLTIGYIAEKAGFQSRTSFSALFKKMTGLTPSEYIKRARSNPEANE